MMTGYVCSPPNIKLGVENDVRLRTLISVWGNHALVLHWSDAVENDRGLILSFRVADVCVMGICPESLFQLSQPCVPIVQTRFSISNVCDVDSWKHRLPHFLRTLILRFDQ